MPQQRGIVDPRLYMNSSDGGILQQQRSDNQTAGTEGILPRGVGKASLAVHRRRHDDVEIDLEKKKPIPPAHRCARDTPTATSVFCRAYSTGVSTLYDESAALRADESTRA